MRRRQLRCWLHCCIAASAVCLLLAAISRGGANSSGPPSAEPEFVESVEAATTLDEFEVQVVTTAPNTPWFMVFPLREPDRLVMDLPEFRWKPGLTAHLPTAHPEIEQIRVGQFSVDPPITRIVLDLTVPAQQMRYRAISATGQGLLRVQVSDEAEASPSQRWTNPTPAAPRPKQPASGVQTTEPRAGEGGSSTAVKPGPDTEGEPGSASRPVAAGVSATPPEPPEPQMAAGGEEPLEEPAPDPGVAATGGEVPEAAEPEVAGEPPAPAPLAVEQNAGPFPWGKLLRLLAAAAVLVAAGLLALWLRRRLSTRERGPAGPIEVSSEAQTSDLRAPAEPEVTRVQPAAASDDPGGVVKCKIVDGYLVLAPEGGAMALSELAPDSRREAAVEGSVELTLGANRAGQRNPQAGSDFDLSAQAKELIDSLGDENIALRKAAAQGLCELAGRGGAEVLLPYLKSEDPRVRLVVAGVLGEAGAADCAGALAEIASDPDPSVRASVLYAFGRLGEKAGDHCDVARAGLSDGESSVRARAIEALASMAPKSEEVAREILALTDDDDPSAREAAVSASYRFVSRGVSQPMVELLADVSRRPHAFELLQQGDETGLRRLLMAARSAPSESGQRALETLSYVMSRGWEAEDFREELVSPDPEVRLAGVEGLAMVGGDDAAGMLVPLARNDPSPQVRKRAAEVLESWKDLAAESAAARKES